MLILIIYFLNLIMNITFIFILKGTFIFTLSLNQLKN